MSGLLHRLADERDRGEHGVCVLHLSLGRYALAGRLYCCEHDVGHRIVNGREDMQELHVLHLTDLESLSHDLFEQFLGELLRMSQFAEIFVSGFAGGTELNAVPLSKYERTMTGGTDVIPAYEQACREDFDCIVVLTDGYLAFPESEPRHTIWVMPESFGRRVEVIL